MISDVLLSTLSSASLPILGLLAYDSPLLGLNPAVFKSTFDKAMDWTSKGQAVLTTLGAGYGFFKSATGGSSDKGQTEAKKATTSSASSKGKGKGKEVATTSGTNNAEGSSWGFLASSVLAGTAAAAVVGAGWYNRDKLVEHWSWATSHLSFVGELWKVSELEERLEKIVECQERGIGFHWLVPLSLSRITDADHALFEMQLLHSSTANSLFPFKNIPHPPNHREANPKVYSFNQYSSIRRDHSSHRDV